MIHKKTQIYTISILFALFMNGCITPDVVTNGYLYEKPKNLRELNVAFMPLDAAELSESEIEDVTDEIIDNLLFYSNIRKVILFSSDKEKLAEINELKTWDKIKYYKNNRVVPALVNKDLLKKWNSSWREYVKNKKMSLDVLNEISRNVKVNSVFQLAVTDVRRKTPIHRKVIAETTVEVSYILFSTTGKILIEGKSVATQANAWSGQMTPRLIEVIDPAVEDIFDKFPLKTVY